MDFSRNFQIFQQDMNGKFFPHIRRNYDAIFHHPLNSPNPLLDLTIPSKILSDLYESPPTSPRGEEISKIPESSKINSPEEPPFASSEAKKEGDPINTNVPKIEMNGHHQHLNGTQTEKNKDENEN